MSGGPEPVEVLIGITITGIVGFLVGWIALDLHPRILTPTWFGLVCAICSVCSSGAITIWVWDLLKGPDHFP